ncbi:MAG: 50S ribosomal protein L19 [Bacteroidales bacterium]|nr:50S ribosomal protein L19 [Bacteroidales bacterium]
MQFVEDMSARKEFPEFKAGDTITVHYKIKEGNKERIQNFQGVVLQRRGSGATETFTVRKVTNGVGVERIFPFSSPFIEQIDVNKHGAVRRARIFYLRNLTGKKARIKEKRV